MGQVDFWQWWILAAALMILEVFTPGAFFLWMGVAAGVVGLLLLVAPATSWQIQLLLFAVLSIVSIVVWRAYLKRHPTESDRPALNRRSEQYVGRSFTLVEPIVNGHGRIKVDDTVWRIEGEDCPAGATVKVVATAGAFLKVERQK